MRQRHFNYIVPPHRTGHIDRGAVSVSLIWVPGRVLGCLRTRGPPASLQALTRALRRTKWRAPASVFSPRAGRDRGLKRPNQPPAGGWRRAPWGSLGCAPVRARVPQPYPHRRRSLPGQASQDERPGRGAALAGLALPARDAQAAENDQEAGIEGQGLGLKSTARVLWVVVTTPMVGSPRRLRVRNPYQRD